jgi:hypothetical protein
VHPPTEYAVLCAVQAVATTVPLYPAAHARPRTEKFWRVTSPLWPDKVYPAAAGVEVGDGVVQTDGAQSLLLRK